MPDPMNLLGRRSDFCYSRFEDYANALAEAQPSFNVTALIGHTALRANLMTGFARPASESEIEAMRKQLALALDVGAIGLSSGLAYKTHARRRNGDVTERAGRLLRRQAA